MTEYKLTEIPCRVLGRTTDQRDPLTLFWTASGVVLRVKASCLSVRVNADYAMYEPWIDVLVDGKRSQKRSLEKGVNEISIFRGCDPAVEREVRILRDTQAMSGDEKTLVQILGVSTDGSFLPVEEPKRKIEFIGDSITSGEGCAGAENEMSWVSAVFDCVDNYAYMTASRLGAEHHVISQSGWGIYCDWRGDTSCTLPGCYEQVCGLVPGARNAELGAKEAWDFSLWQPDVIVVNLGTNDMGSFSSAGQVFEPGGFRDPMRVNEDGTPNAEDLKHIEDAAVSFLQMLRKNNPAAHILWAYGMLGNDLMPTLSSALARYTALSGDRKAELLELENTLPGEFGSRTHPGHPSHEKAARGIAEKIASLL